jgi:hypothetical protein
MVFTRANSFTFKNLHSALRTYLVFSSFLSSRMNSCYFQNITKCFVFSVHISGVNCEIHTKFLNITITKFTLYCPWKFRCCLFSRYQLSLQSIILAISSLLDLVIWFDKLISGYLSRKRRPVSSPCEKSSQNASFRQMRLVITITKGTAEKALIFNC